MLHRLYIPLLHQIKIGAEKIIILARTFLSLYSLYHQHRTTKQPREKGVRLNYPAYDAYGLLMGLPGFEPGSRAPRLSRLRLFSARNIYYQIPIMNHV